LRLVWLKVQTRPSPGTLNKSQKSSGKPTLPVSALGSDHLG